MRKARAVVQSNLTAEEARRAVLSLLSEGMDAEAHRAPPEPAAPEPPEVEIPVRSGWEVSVPLDEVREAAVVVDEAIAPGAFDLPREEPATLLPQPPGGIWTLRHASGAIVLAAVFAAIHLTVHPDGGRVARSAMIDAGAVAPWLVRQGEWWRLLSAAFLHFDLQHLVGNTSSLLLLAPPLAATVGQLRVGLLFVATALAGNLASQLLGSEAAVKAGASGGICGLLGALAGVAIAVMARATDARQRRPAWQTLGALAALFGMIVGFEPGRDHYAHVGGLFAGIALGRVIVPAPPAAGPAGEDTKA